MAIRLGLRPRHFSLPLDLAFLLGLGSARCLLAAARASEIQKSLLSLDSRCVVYFPIYLVVQLRERHELPSRSRNSTPDPGGPADPEAAGLGAWERRECA